ncbi:MAG: hypothetical protein J3K34DRAFT_525019 [Monoraphidium minutum]|nr:MAG: hypothetical protein J3K34DRAFT_525019 [Monoraphidium minutum]
MQDAACVDSTKGGGASSGGARGAAPRLTALPEAELDAIVCALDPRHRAALRLVCRRLCGTVEARGDRVVIAVWDASGSLGGPPAAAAPPPRGVPLAALGTVAGRFPRATRVYLHSDPDRDDYPASQLAAVLQQLPDGAWPAAEAAASLHPRLNRISPPSLLEPRVLLELARLCPHLRSAEAEFEITDGGWEASLFSSDVKCIAAACPALLELRLPRRTDIKAGVGQWQQEASYVLPHLTLLKIGGAVFQRLLDWAPKLLILEVKAHNDLCQWFDASAHRSLRRLVFCGAQGGARNGASADAWMRGVGHTFPRLQELVFRFDSGLCSLLHHHTNGVGENLRTLADKGVALPYYLLCWSPALRSLALEIETSPIARVPLSVTQILGVLSSAPLAATLAELRLSGVGLGPEVDAARALLYLPTFPRLEVLYLGLRAYDNWERGLYGDGYEDAICAELRALVAPVNGPGQLAAGAAAGPRVEL